MFLLSFLQFSCQRDSELEIESYTTKVEQTKYTLKPIFKKDTLANKSLNHTLKHIYMANIISNMSSNISNFVEEKYGYPVNTENDYYEAVCWSGMTHLTDGTINPVFSDNYPDFDDQLNIIKIFNTENGTATYSGYTPLIDNNCN